MAKRGLGAASMLLPLYAGMLACASGYKDLNREIDAAVAAAQPDSATVAAAAQPPAPAAAAVTAQPGEAAAQPGPAAGIASRTTTVANLAAPEAVVMDTASDLIIVAGSETVASGSRGVIARLTPDGTVQDNRWIVGGLKGAVLRAPRGMAIVGDTLWVTDRTMLRGFHRRTGRPLATIAFAPLGAVSLTDVVAGKDGTLYVTDAAVTYSARGVAQPTGKDRIYQVTGRKPTVALESTRLGQPMSVSWDPLMERLIIGGGATDTLFGWRPGAASPEVVGVAPGPWDGVVALGGMALYASSSARGTLHHFQSGMGRTLTQSVRGAGDFAVDTRRGRLLVPLPAERRLEVWEVRR